MKVDDNGESLNTTRGRDGCIVNQANSKGGDKSKYKCQQTRHFKKDCLSGGTMMTLFSIALERYEDVGLIVGSCCELKEGGVVHH